MALIKKYAIIRKMHLKGFSLIRTFHFIQDLQIFFEYLFFGYSFFLLNQLFNMKSLIASMFIKQER